MTLRKALSLSSMSHRTDDNPYISIENFENPEFKDSKWVLTSPRSLLACDNLKIKPSEIVAQSLKETFEDLGTRNATLPVVYQIFSEKEIERKIKVSKIRLERMRLIDHETDSVKLGEKSIRNLYETLWREEQELINEDPPLISTQRSEDNSSRIEELETKLAALKAKAHDLGVLPATRYTEACNSTASLYRPQKYDHTNYTSRYLDDNELFDPYSYKQKYPTKPVFDMKAESLAKQADYEANFERTLQNSKRIQDIAQDYYQAKVENKNNMINKNLESKHRFMAERSMKIFLDRQQKQKWREQNLNRSQNSDMMRSLVNMTKIRNKENFIDAKNRHKSLTVRDIFY